MLSKPKLTKAEAGRIGGQRSRGGGRPKGSSKYKTDEERLAAKRASALASYHKRKNRTKNSAD
ncbi:MAG: hypothetical protein KF855_03325 [Acidobacteria bacterium]|nr:hypothetical protein [Acidobacteriota bacterium]